MDPDRPVTPPGKRVQSILGEDAGTTSLTPKPLFSEMEELLWDNGDSCWKETARWIKFEEDVEESGNRFSKPHVGTLSLHALFELRSFLLNGALLFDIGGSTLDQISSIVVDQMICGGNLPLKKRDSVKATILKRHRHVFEGEKKKYDEGEKSKSDLNPLMRLPIIRSFSKPSFADVPSDPDLMNDPYLLGKGNIHFMKKIPPGAEASNILVGEVDFLDNPIAAFIRLAQAHELGDLTEVPVPTRFIFLLLGTVGNLARYHEVGRAMGTLMSDEVCQSLLNAMHINAKAINIQTKRFGLGPLSVVKSTPLTSLLMKVKLSVSGLALYQYSEVNTTDFTIDEGKTKRFGLGPLSV